MEERDTVKQVLSSEHGMGVVRRLLEERTDWGRVSLAKAVCQELSLKDWRGAAQWAGCLKALRELEAKELLRLPAARLRERRSWTPRRLGRPVEEPKQAPERVEAMGALELLEVGRNDASMRIWNELISSEHDLHSCRLVGRQLRYLIGSEHGWLGALAFGSAALKLRARDEWIGWSPEQRRRGLERVVNLSRLLIRPSVHCQNLASRVLSLALRRLPDDFERIYGLRPWLVETFVNPQRYPGTSFRAANWVEVGTTQGRGRNDRQGRAEQGIKVVYLYELESDFRRRWGLRDAGIEPLGLDAGLQPEEWAAQEFGGADLGDPRRVERLIRIASDQGSCPDGSYLSAADGNGGAIHGYYRFMESSEERIDMEHILAPHIEQTKRRMRGLSRVYAIQDTTQLDFSTRADTTGLGVIGANQTSTKSRGLNLHTTLVVDRSGATVGILSGESFAGGEAPATRKVKNRNASRIEEKESGRWLRAYQRTVAAAEQLPGLDMMAIMDREADIYELFQAALASKNRVPLLIRLQHNRRLQDSELKLVDQLRQAAPDFEIQMRIPRQRTRYKKGKKVRSGKPARLATLAVHYEPVEICAPQVAAKKDWPSLKLWVVRAVEANAPAEAEPIEWILLTTRPVTTPKQARQCLVVYRYRWRIEDYHRVLKSGCRVEKLQLTSRKRLERALAIAMVVAWRVMHLTLLGRKAPNLPCDVFFESAEWQVLSLAIKKKCPANRRA